MTMPVLEITDVSKRFGDTLANDGISMSLGKGEIVALLGENGAGKTTLMSILFGHYVPDTGHIRIDGEELPPGRPRAAIGAGVGMVHQHFSLAANLTVNPLEAVTTVTVQIVTLLVGDQEFDSPKTLAAFALGLVLFIVTLALNVLALHIVRKYREQYE